MEKYALFLGCNIPVKVEQYESSARAVLNKLNVEVTDIDTFNCCGYPLKNVDQTGWLLSSARNIALAEGRGQNLLTLCQCCFGSLKTANAKLKEDKEAKDRINNILAKEGLEYQGICNIEHLLSVLHNEVTLEKIEEKTIDKYKDLNIATHYGCHALRPSKIMEFDDPLKPSLFDNLVNITGAQSIEWALKLDCCGAPVLGINDNLSYDLTEKKLQNAKTAGADFICVSCPWCYMQFDKMQGQIASERGNVYNLPSILYSQLLGLRLGIAEKDLGIAVEKENDTVSMVYSKLIETEEKGAKKRKKKKTKKKVKTIK